MCEGICHQKLLVPVVNDRFIINYFEVDLFASTYSTRRHVKFECDELINLFLSDMDRNVVHVLNAKKTP